MKKITPLPFSILYILFFTVFTLSSCFKNNSRRSGNDDVTVISDLSYGSNKDLNGNTVNLKLDVYMPKDTSSFQKFPLVLFVHGGGFTEGDKSDFTSQMKKFAREGYVAVSINYRLNTSTGDPCDEDSIISKKSTYMAVQDARAATRFMVANADLYHIEASKIFFMGNSAGAVTVLNANFLSQTDFNHIIPGIEAELGSINTADNTLTNIFNITAIAANSGCIPSPGYVTTSNAVPVIFFHGGQDDVIPVDKGHTYNCSSSEFVYGSRSVYQRLVQLNKNAVLHVDPSGSHLPYSQNFLFDNELCFFNSVMNEKTETGSFTGQASSCQ